ncbi:MAG TPA: hypothetical protein DHV77_10935 [Erysipelotrichaceae bacterium]|uniref:hypothetical protein n=1 Tax=Sharpea azabuensis TaxID=322505 RepID=UPI000ED2EE65|nr:hypothetical protein [Sharpea azabuensis]HCJ15551.1 hypothetical protein [Erysipelotrichaceae bacterium]
MDICFAGKNYLISKFTTKEQFIKELKQILPELFENDEIKWNCSFMINNQFYNAMEVFDALEPMTKEVYVLLQLAGG